MNAFARRTGRLALALAVAAGVLVGLTPAAGAAEQPAADPVQRALARLDLDADRALTIREDGAGAVEFVGVPARAEVDNPAVRPSMSAGAAADAAVDRYGAAVGGAQDGTTLERTAVQPTAAGDVARYQQEVEGVPVLGGQVVVSLRSDGELSSMLSRTTEETSVDAAKVSEGDAAEQAQAAFVKASGAGVGVQVDRQGRWLVDAGLIGGSGTAPARTVWRFEVTRDTNERRMVLVDDRTGGIVMNVDLIAHADRVVCDNANVRRSADVPCTIGYEGMGAVSHPDVATAYDLSGVVADFYEQVGDIDLTTLLGVETAGGKKLASTVRWCYTTSTDSPTNCPYDNAFWNGKQMYYGTGYAGADDVVGHEVTHGFTERHSGLFYWGQSGAMNESISDIIGEIVDHRHASSGDSATNWAIGEDVPDFAAEGGLRNMQDPTLHGQPDKTSSSYYVQEDNAYPDNDGVHSNSGVGNKTFYLISQGGSFNGQTITGIDADDRGLTKSAKLWLLVDQTLSSGSDYADEAAVLEQSCQALLATGSVGFTAADCTAVHQATLATELRQTPTQNAQSTDAAATCAAGTKRVLFDSETGNPATKFTTTTWSRDSALAHTGPDSWSVGDLDSVATMPLKMRSGVALPPGQPSYLYFHQWRVLDWEPGDFYYDVGTVEVDATGSPADAAGLPWVNGPTDVINKSTGNTATATVGFGGDSRGFIASRADLSSYAGSTVTAQFTLHTDSSIGVVGWAVDDVTVYTCDPVVVPAPTTTPTTVPAPTTTPTTTAVLTAGKPTIAGKARVGKRLTARAGTWKPAGVTVSYQWLRNRKPITKATKPAYKLTAKDRGKRISVRVTGTKAGYATTSATSKATAKVKAKPRKPKKHR